MHTKDKTALPKKDQRHDSSNAHATATTDTSRKRTTRDVAGAEDESTGSDTDDTTGGDDPSKRGGSKDPSTQSR